MHINQTTLDWVESIRPHWTRTQGNIHGDTKFWNQCIHGVTHDTWLEIVAAYKEVTQHHNWISSVHPKLDEDMYEVFWRASWHDTGEETTRVHMTIPHNKEGYNKPVFRAVMAFKDVVGELTGRPFTDLSKPKSLRKNKPSRAEVMAKYEELGRVINDLFETKE